MTDAPAAPGWYEVPGGRGAVRWWDGARWHDQQPAVQQQPVSAGTSTSTWAIWVLALTPLVGIVSILLQDPAAQFRASIARSIQQDPGAIAGVGGAATVGTLLSSLLSLVLIAASALLGLQDQRMLRARGVVRPFPWGWAFLSPVYVIGRSVVVRRRVRGSLAPLWVWIAAYAVTFLVVIAVLVAAFASAFAAAQGQVSGLG